MADSAQNYSESPVFKGFEGVSLSFAFECSLDTLSLQPAHALRITKVYAELFGKKPRLAEEQLKRAHALFGPSRSFLDDITTGFPGVNGRPLLLSASARPAEHVTLVRPESWGYHFENEYCALHVPEPLRHIPLDLHEHLCLFESGRVFYIVTLSQDMSFAPLLNEYGIIHLQQLAVRPERAEQYAYLGFSWSDRSGSLFDLARWRLAQLADEAGEPDGAANALRDVLMPFGIVANPADLALPHSPAVLRSALVQIEDADLFHVAQHAHTALQIGADSNAAHVLAPAHRIREADAAWRAALAGDREHGLPPHDFDSDSANGEDSPSRPLLAVAGIAQGIPDFPRQDNSEIHDSTRPVAVALENLFYVHPRFEFEVGENWRTFRDARGSVGGCPYALLTWLITIHDELIVADLEARIENMVLGEVDEDAPLASIGRVEPLADLSRLMDRVSSWIKPRDPIIDRNLQTRIDIYRWCSIFQSGNVFRYPTERAVLQAIREARGTEKRFEDAHAMLDRFEGLVEDVTALSSSYSAARTNWLLGAIASISVLTLPKTMADLMAQIGMNPAIGTSLLLFAAVLIAFLSWNSRLQLKRSRKSS